MVRAKALDVMISVINALGLSSGFDKLTVSQLSTLLPYEATSRHFTSSHIGYTSCSYVVPLTFSAPGISPITLTRNLTHKPPRFTHQSTYILTHPLALHPPTASFYPQESVRTRISATYNHAFTRMVRGRFNGLT